MRRFEPEPPRRSPAAGPRAPEPLPAEAAVLGLQHAAGNRAVSALLARQPSPTAPETKPAKQQSRASTSTLGLGEKIGVIPLDSASIGHVDAEGNVHDIHVYFVNNPAVPRIQEAMARSEVFPEGFYSSRSGKLVLHEILITSMTSSYDAGSEREIFSAHLNFTAAEFEPVRRSAA